MSSRLASLFTAVDVGDAESSGQEAGGRGGQLLLIGERANATGSKKFREMLLANDFDGMLRVLKSQEAAHVLDLSVAYAGRDELSDMQKIVSLAAPVVKQPLMIDSTNPAVIEAALMRCPGRPIVNSVNLEDGGKTLSRVAVLAKTWGAMLVALTIDEKGMALTAERKVETALRLRDTLREYGLRDEDIFFDCLTFTIGSGDESLFSAAKETLDAIREITRRMPKCHTLLGLSNVSFGLKPACRRLVNSVFLNEALGAGLTAAIVDASGIRALQGIDETEKELALSLIYNRREGVRDPLADIIRHFEAPAGASPGENSSGDASSGKAGNKPGLINPPEKILAEKIMKGNRDGLEDILAALRERYPPASIINTLLVPVMRRVGELFGSGEMLLPFVLQAAETMREAVSLLEPHLPKTAHEERLKILLATVQGDVHDIGKNLVDIILSNNGCKVYNIGIKQSAENIIAKAKEYKVDAIGLSGLLVKSALLMKESLPQYAEAGLTIPILLGGAALTRRFVAEECAPRYPGPVVYCKDPFEALSSLEAHSRGALRSTLPPPASGGGQEKTDPAEREERPGPAPRLTPPFTGPRLAPSLSFEETAAAINKEMLFRGRWGFRRNTLSPQEYQRLIHDTVEPLYSRLLQTIAGHAHPQAAYGYFYAQVQDDSLRVTSGGKNFTFDFPRRSPPAGLCITDFFQPETGPAILPLFAVTLGEETASLVQKTFTAGTYQDYLFLHGLAAELTDALAQIIHQRIAAELGGACPGVRYGFGYPACPNL
ncbi:MAG: dihydropteroate synthase, partial [Spirochaetales bacterium]|nr:dihydropteroate synthase [Spirochaetales bacterium]